VERVFKALSDPTRRQVLQLLRSGPKTAGELSASFTVSKPTMSAHFNVLREANLVEVERSGKQLIYHLKISVLEDVLLGFADSFGIGHAPAATPPLKGRLKNREVTP
jgi:DNA-binding transcriptional ArsR family regulator